MKRPPDRALAFTSRSGGFTLIELLVAMTVLALMLFMVAELTDGAATLIAHADKHLDADSEARLIFNRMAVDFGLMLKRSDVDYSSFKTPSNLQSGNDQMAFYTETSGYFSGATQPPGTGKAGMSLVAYMIANDAYTSAPSLQRLGKGLGWQPDSSGSASWSNVSYLPLTLVSKWPSLFVSDPDYKSIGDQVFRIEYTYLLKATPTQPARLSLTPWNTSVNTSINGFEDVAAIVVTIAILDDSSRLLVTNYTNLTSSLPDALDPTIDITYQGHVAAAWNAVIASPTYAATVNLPRQSVANVRVYERYFYLDSLQ